MVTGIGGVFFKAKDAPGLTAWYREHLDLPAGDETFAIFPWRQHDDPESPGATVWSAFPEDTEYFGPEDQQWMVNYRVDDLEAILARLAAAGVRVAEEREESEYGRFGWVFDSEGNRVELWEPPAGS